MIVLAGITDDEAACNDGKLNRTGEVYRFFKHHHDKHYRLANLSHPAYHSSVPGESKYDKRSFDPGSIIDYPTEDSAVPSFDSLIRYCDDVSKWLTADSANVIATHCRTGTVRSSPPLRTVSLFVSSD